MKLIATIRGQDFYPQAPQVGPSNFRNLRLRKETNVVGLIYFAKIST